jgi:hypothetical protein
MEEGKKTTVYLPAELSESLRLLAFQMYTTVSDLLAVAAEERLRSCIDEGARTVWGPKQPSEEWRALRAVMTRRRQAKLYARRDARSSAGKEGDGLRTPGAGST